jgi:membrane fusion protein (multidrug efflux system)
MADAENLRQPRKQGPRRLLLLIGPLVAIGVAAWMYLAGGRYVGTDNAYVQADMLTIAAEVSGRAVEVPVATNQRVEAGQLLIRIDDTPYRIAVMQARAQLAAAHDEIQALHAAYRAAGEQLKQARNDVQFQTRELRRLQGLAAEKFVSEAQIDAAQQKLTGAQTALAALEQEAARIKASLGGDPRLPVERHPRYLAAQAQLEKAELDLARTEIRAPRPGVIGSGPPLPGDLVSAGRPLFSLVFMDDVWVDANLKETDLTNVQVGQPATITVDAYPGKVWRARVASISPASGAEFSLLPPQNATGNWVKVVQRIPVRLALESDAGLPPLRAGMSAVVEIDTAAPESVPAQELGQR